MGGLSNAQLSVLGQHLPQLRYLPLLLEEQRRTNQLLETLLVAMGHGALIPAPPEPVKFSVFGKLKK